MKCIIKEERFSNIRHELPDMFAAHYYEAVMDKDGLKEDCDWNKYIMLDNCGVIHCTTARVNGILIGYFFALINFHLHHAGLKVGVSDMIYVMPEYRKTTGAGIKLIRETERMLRAKGIQKMYILVPEGRYDTMLKRLGYRFTETGHSKWIGQ